MKKILAVLFVLAMTMTLAFPAFASELNGLNSSGSIPISGKFDNTQKSQEASVISVDIKWDANAMTFEYTKPHIGTWNPEKNAYDGAVEGGWSDAKLPITVANHSDVCVMAVFGFTRTVQDIFSCEFYKKNSNNTYFDMECDYILLESAVGKSKTEADSEVVYLGISGYSITTDGKIGTVTITISDATRKVSSITELQNAAREGGYIILQNDIDLGNATATILKDAVIDLNGHTLTSSKTAIYSSSYTTIKNGTVKCTGTDDYCYAIRAARSISIEDCTLSSSTPTVIFANAYVADVVIGLREVIIQTTNNTTGWLELDDESTEKFRLELSGNIENGTGLELPQNMLSSGEGIYGIYISSDSSGSVSDYLTITVGEGCYKNFDPTNYYDQSRYNLNSDDVIWYVTSKN